MRARTRLPSPSLIAFVALASCAPRAAGTTTTAQLPGNGPVQTVNGLPVIRQRPATIPGSGEVPVPAGWYDDAGARLATGSADGGSRTLPPAEPLPGVPAGEAVSRIVDEAAWQALASSPSRETMARTEVVKVVIDLEDSNRVYFLNTRQWEIHYYFIQRYLARPGRPILEAEAFWQREYLSNNRRFLQVALIRYRDQNTWGLELIAQDVLDLPRTIDLVRRVRERVFFGADLKYHPVPAHHIAAVEQLRAQVPVVTTDELFRGVQYQPLNPGEAFGYLRIFNGPIDAARVRRNDIVVLAEPPLDLPTCAGVITAELQTPLSHIAVLSANRGTPNMALRGATANASLRALEGQLVRLHVTPQEYTVTRASQQDAERAWSARRPAQAFNPVRDLRDVGLPTLQTLRIGDLQRVGAKAAQLAELWHVRPALNVPRGFVVPFFAYDRHLRTHHLDAMLHGLMTNGDFENNPTAREAALTTLRQRIADAPVDPGLLRAIRTQVQRALPGAAFVRLRSSTNAEDLPGFNGAGLYTSTRVAANASDEEFATALRRVWASTWNFAGFEERSYFRIAHERVAMAVLVQESIEDDTATGVAITGNPFDEGRPGLFINAQVSAGSVTSAGNGEVPEQLLFYTYPEPGSLERLSSSSRTSGANILSDAEARGLSDQLRAIQEHFFPGQGFQSGDAMDVEFLVSGPARRIVIVQARPYHIVWNEGRGWAQPPRG